MSVSYKLRMFAIAIFISSILAGLCFAIASHFVARDTSVITVSVGFIAAFAAVPIVSVFGLLIAMPIAYLLNSVGVRGYLAWGFIGLLVGAGTCFGLAVFLSGGSFTDWTLSDVLAWVAMGAFPGFGAGLFWWRTVAQFEHEKRVAS